MSELGMVAGSKRDDAVWGTAPFEPDLGSGAGTLDASSADASFVPPCNGPTEPSTLEIRPFEPSASA